PTNDFGKLIRVDRRAHNQTVILLQAGLAVCSGMLSERNINLLTRLRVERAILCIRRHSDNRHKSRSGLVGRSIEQANSFADRVLVGPLITRQSLIDDGCGLRAFSIEIGEEPAFHQPYSHCLKILWADGTEIRTEYVD